MTSNDDNDNRNSRQGQNAEPASDASGPPPRGRGRSRPPNEGTSDAAPPNSDPLIAAIHEQAQLAFIRRTGKAKKAVKAASDACD
jgi:hypothetical protein